MEWMEACTQSFTEADADRIEWVRKLLERHTSLRCDMPEPSTVEMHLDIVGVGKVRNGDNFLLRDDGSVERIL